MMVLMTTKIPDLIIELQHAKGPDRQLDTGICMILGYERRKVTIDIEGGGTERTKRWFRPGKKDPVRIPRYTGSIDVANRLANDLVPGCSAGFSWGNCYATAKIDDGPTFNGSTPPIALCIAALSARHMQKT